MSFRPIKEKKFAERFIEGAGVSLLEPLVSETQKNVIHSLCSMILEMMTLKI